MKPIVILLLLIAVVLVLYFGALGLGFARNGSGNGGKPTSLDDMGGAWLDALGGVSAWFAPKIELKGLLCNDQPVEKLFRLREAGNNDPRDTCTLSIGTSDEEYRKAELRALVLTPGTPEPAVYVWAVFDEGRFPQAKYGDKCATELEPFRLELRFDPAGDPPDDPWECWLRQKDKKPVALTVLKGGGQLVLQCVGCSAAQRKELVLQMK